MFNRSVVGNVSDLIAAHLQKSDFQDEVKQLLGGDFSVRMGSASFARDGSNVVFKVEMAVKDSMGMTLNREAQTWQREAHSYGLPSDWFGKTFQYQGSTFKITGLNTRRPKFPVSAENLTHGGRPYKFPVSVVVLAMGVKERVHATNELFTRTQDDIINDLRKVDNRLSPENLTCDGELARSKWLPKRNKLLAERARLVEELGREPTDAEMYPGIF